MAEYISREKAIKELREVYENEYPTASGDFDEYASHDVPNVLRNMKVADAQPANPWIKVNDRLPKTNTIGVAHVLAYDRYEGVVKADFLDESANYCHGSNIFIISNTSTPLYKVTHWMPLPKPPEDSDTKQKNCTNCKWHTILKNHLKEDMPVCRHEVTIDHGAELKVSCCVYYEPKER